MDLNTKEIGTRYLDELANFIGAQDSLPNKDGLPLLAIGKKRKLDYRGKPVGFSNPNPIIDLKNYELEFPDGTIEEYLMTMILENILD